MDEAVLEVVREVRDLEMAIEARARRQEATPREIAGHLERQANASAGVADVLGFFRRVMVGCESREEGQDE